MAQRNLYLSNTPVDEAREKYLDALHPETLVQYETVPVPESLGRVTRKATFARYSSPLFNASAMDGIATTAAKTDSARERRRSP